MYGALIKFNYGKICLNSCLEDLDNSYLKVTATDAKSDIVIASSVNSYDNEPQMALELYQKANENCSNLGSYNRVIADSNFVTLDNCERFEKQGVALIGPTKEYESKRWNNSQGDDKITFEYDNENNCVRCSQGAHLFQTATRFNLFSMHIDKIAYLIMAYSLSVSEKPEVRKVLCRVLEFTCRVNALVNSIENYIEHQTDIFRGSPPETHSNPVVFFKDRCVNGINEAFDEMYRVRFWNDLTKPD